MVLVNFLRRHIPDDTVLRVLAFCDYVTVILSSFVGSRTFPYDETCPVEVQLALFDKYWAVLNWFKRQRLTTLAVGGYYTFTFQSCDDAGVHDLSLVNKVNYFMRLCRNGGPHTTDLRVHGTVRKTKNKRKCCGEDQPKSFHNALEDEGGDLHLLVYLPASPLVPNGRLRVKVDIIEDDEAGGVWYMTFGLLEALLVQLTQMPRTSNHDGLMHLLNHFDVSVL